jgi:murein DD-endopeptidase MepM/ murein hydrolase activator NlpD
MCSPLDDFTLQTLPKIITQPYKNPPPGDETLHHGIDFSFWTYGQLKTMTGLKIFSVLSGTVAGITLNKYPYGNMVIVETSLDALPQDLISQLQAPTPAPTLPYTGPLSCPQYPQNPTWDTSKRSLYLLYAHMKDAPLVKIGDHVSCGQQLGVVGNTGDSSNNHLHFETNIGPSGARFNSMGHYSAGMTAEEIANYCIWRVSNLFQLFNPMKLLSLSSP